jgi:hypothetical protein
VQVRDADGLAAENAAVYIAEESTRRVFSAIPAGSTDRLGNAVFSGVPNGAVAFAVKGSDSGYSQAWNGRGALSIRLMAQDAELTVRALDSGKTVSGVKVRVVSRSGETLGEDATDAAGTARFYIPKGTLVMAEGTFSGGRVSRSQSVLLVSDNTLSLEAPAVTLGRLNMRFDGFFGSDGETPLEELAAGARYRMRFTVDAPLGAQAGVFVALDSPHAWIERMDGGNWSAIGGTTLHETDGAQLDLASSNMGFPARWAEASAATVDAQRSVIEAVVDVEEGFDAQLLSFSFRAWARAGEEWQLLPSDGSFDATHSDTLLYARTLDMTIPVRPIEEVPCAADACDPSDLPALSLRADEDTLSALSSGQLHLTVADARSQEPVADALIWVRQVGPDQSVTIRMRHVPSDGKISVTVPAVSPHTVFDITASASGYSPASLSLEATAFALFSPDRWSITLTDSLPARTIDWTVSNVSTLPFSVTRSFAEGDFVGVLDTDALSQSLDALSGQQVDAGASKRIGVRWARATAARDASARADGIQVVEIDAGGSVFVSALPVSVGVGNAVAQAASCLSINHSEWRATTIENRSDFAFILQNECADLKTVYARLEWESDNSGTAELSLADTDGIVLQPHEALPAATIAARGTIPGLLSFAPATTGLGSTARFRVRRRE